MSIAIALVIVVVALFGVTALAARSDSSRRRRWGHGSDRGGSDISNAVIWGLADGTSHGDGHGGGGHHGGGHSGCGGGHSGCGGGSSCGGGSCGGGSN